MKVLWVTNIIFPELASKIGEKEVHLGGWMTAMASSILMQSPEIKLGIATVYKGKHFLSEEINNIVYYLLPLHKDNRYYNSSLEKYWTIVLNSFSPDVIHLHGTEYGHGLALLNVNNQRKIPFVVSIQGLVSVYQKYFTNGLSFWDIYRNITFHDIIKRENIYQAQKRFKKSGEIEKEIIKRASHIIGRTEWDKAHCLAYNPSAHYYKSNEILRQVFYENAWNYNRCEPHSIFVSQATYPIKGFHFLLDALPLIKHYYPDVKVYVTGNNPFSSNSIQYLVRRRSYEKYIKRKILHMNLSDTIHWTGILNADAMCSQYLKANVFVLCSTIENSPNSLGEAQLLGVPVVASYVGGVPDMMKGAEEFMYRFDDIEMLALKICNTFQLAENIDTSIFRNLAIDRHNIQKNVQTQVNIYNNIIK